VHLLKAKHNDEAVLSCLMQQVKELSQKRLPRRDHMT